MGVAGVSVDFVFNIALYVHCLWFSLHFRLEAPLRDFEVLHASTNAGSPVSLIGKGLAISVFLHQDLSRFLVKLLLHFSYVFYLSFDFLPKFEALAGSLNSKTNLRELVDHYKLALLSEFKLEAYLLTHGYLKEDFLESSETFGLVKVKKASR